MKRLLALILVAFICSPSFAQFDARRYVLTEATIEKLKVVQGEIERQGINTNDDLSGNDTVAVMAKKIEANKPVSAELAKQGLTPMDCALTVNALLRAGLYLAAEQNGDSIRAMAMMNGFTPEEKANVEVLKKAGKK